jgi:hypothetical protein
VDPSRLEISHWDDSQVLQLPVEQLEGAAIEVVTDASYWARGFVIRRSTDVHVVGRANYGTPIEPRIKLLAVNGSRNVHLLDPDEFADWGDSAYERYFSKQQEKGRITSLRF